MKLSVLALDYDGTIARADTLDVSVRDAIAATRARGVLVLLVTGRILDELRRVAGDLHFVDGVIAENGAVLHFPSSGQTLELAPAVSGTYLEELRRRDIPHQAGRCLVDAAAAHGPQLLDVIRALELPLVLLFNRSRLMTLPQGVSKATGLRAALEILRASPRNTVAIGDAENDHELIRLAELGMAVEWGSGTLRAAADAVVPGDGPAAVAPHIRRLGETGRIPLPDRARRRLQLGYQQDGREFSLAVRGRNILVTGDARSGKSWLTGLLCEQLILHGYSLCVIDSDGDYGSLQTLPGVGLLGGHHSPPLPCDLMEALRYADRSVVIDLSHQRHDEKVDYVRTVLPGLSAMRRQCGLPHRIVLDDAHEFLSQEDATPLIDLTFTGYVVVTDCASRLPKDLLGVTEVVIATCASDSVEVEGLRMICGCGGCMHTDCACWCQRIGHLGRGKAAALPITSEAEGELRVFTVAPRLTPHFAQRQRYSDVPVPENRAFVFAANGHPSRRHASTLGEFVTVLEQAPEDSVKGHLLRGDFSRWIRDVFGDRTLAANLRALEDRYRMGRDRNPIPDIVHAVRSRYILAGDTSA